MKLPVGGCSATLVEAVCAPAASLSTLATYLKASAPKAIASALELGTFQSLLDLKRTLHLSNATIGYLQAFVMSSRNPTKVAFQLPVGLVDCFPSTAMHTHLNCLAGSVCSIQICWKSCASWHLNIRWPAEACRCTASVSAEMRECM